MAEGVNRAILVGYLGKDPELSYTQSGTGRCRFSVATTETYVNQAGERQDKTEWHNIVVWGKQAETVAKYLQKGRQVYLEGKIQTRSWDDKDGNKKYMTEINSNKVVFLGGGGGGGGGRGTDQGGHSGGQTSQGGSQSSGPEEGFSGGGYGPDDDDIPF